MNRRTEWRSRRRATSPLTTCGACLCPGRLPAARFMILLPVSDVSQQLSHAGGWLWIQVVSGGAAARPPRRRRGRPAWLLRPFQPTLCAA
jgi:hypothetical protein